MGASPDPLSAALMNLLEHAHLATPGELTQVVTNAADELAWHVRVYLVDYEQRILVPTTGEPAYESVGVDSSLAGMAYQRVQAMHTAEDPRHVWVPLVDGVERLGVLGIVLPPSVDPDAPGLTQQLRLFALLTAHLIAVKMPYGDSLDWFRRRRPRTVAAELLWQLLPPLTFGCDGLVVAGVLEPCYEVAGDVFDYSVTGSTAHLMILDSTGHDLLSGTLSAAAVAAARKGRREGYGLLETVKLVDETIATYFSNERFATGILAELDLPSGRLRYVNAGHPAPFVLRGGKVVKTLNQGGRAMFGLDLPGQTEIGHEQLEPDDRLVLYSDGVTEARDTTGAFFGVHRLVDTLELGAAADQPAPETLRRVVRAVLEYQGNVLQDDATLLIAEWSSAAAHRLYPS